MEKNRWLYAILGTIILLFSGLIYAWSIFANSIIKAFPSWSITTISFTFTLCMSFFCLGGLLAGIIYKKIGVRLNFILSALLFLSGFFIVSKVNTPLSLYIGYGIMAGLAAGISYNSVMTVITGYFPDKPGLISGILLMGFGIGSFVIGKVYQRLINLSYDWRNIFFNLGIILSILLIFSSFILKKKNESQEAIIDEDEKSQIPPKLMLKKKLFWFFFLWAILLSSIGLSIIPQASGIILEISPSISTETISTIVGIISIFNGVGRILFGGLFDKIGRNNTILLNEFLFTLALILMLVSIYNKNIILLVIAFIFVGLAYGGVPTTNSAFIASSFGKKYYSVNFSLINMNILIASFAGTLAAKIYSSSGSYLFLIYCMLGVTIISAIIGIFIKNN